MGRADSENVKKAKTIIRKEWIATPNEVLELAKALEAEQAFGYARRIVVRARENQEAKENPHLRLKLAQRHALYTYKDPDLPAEARLDAALEILKEVDDPAQSKDQETLGITGAIHKRKWEIDSQKLHLERSLAYYLRGYQEGISNDDGYTAINAAFVLDLLAEQETLEATKANSNSESAALRREHARKIRGEVVSVLPCLSGTKKPWWFFVTIAEAYFGLERWDEARAWLEQATDSNKTKDKMKDWEYESTARQFARLAQIQEGAGAGRKELGTKLREVLNAFLGEDVKAFQNIMQGKVGLGLSGGGFRASLFHIGVLARLAELDMLRHVEVLSCVSGGSIVGAHYYLEVRNLLQTKPDAKITRDDYIDIVQRIEKNFLAGVQRNLRTRVVAEWLTNLKMIFHPTYSRTERIGELYEREIYATVGKSEKKQDRKNKIWLNDLFIQPLGAPNGFSPRRDNWHRSAKVPILILNATSLNTGHNWQFTASWMGEPPAGIDDEIDGNDRLRRFYYNGADTPPKYRQIRLGHAVAASACVPGLFEPLALTDLYPNRTVRLVDGGVNDNQGVAGLLCEDCTVLLVSDASGQMESEKNPGSGPLAVPLRSNSILMGRVRIAQYHELGARRRSSLLRGLMFIHMKKELEVDPIDWNLCQDPYDPIDDVRPRKKHGSSTTTYGIPKKIQKRLAAIRTDLDSFSDMEAYALMLSGYRMTKEAFPHTITDFPAAPVSDPVKWKFLGVEKYVDRLGEEDPKLKDLLDVAKQQAFKVWRLSKALRVIGTITAVLLLAGLVSAAIKFWSVPLITVGWIASIIAAAVTTLVVGSFLSKIIYFGKTLTNITIGIAMALGGFLAARIHLHFFDRWYLAWGRIKAED